MMVKNYQIEKICPGDKSTSSTSILPDYNADIVLFFCNSISFVIQTVDILMHVTHYFAFDLIKLISDRI